MWSSTSFCPRGCGCVGVPFVSSVAASDSGVRCNDPSKSDVSLAKLACGLDMVCGCSVERCGGEGAKSEWGGEGATTAIAVVLHEIGAHYRGFREGLG